MLKGYSDENYISQGFSTGFKVGHQGISNSVVSRNSSSVLDNPSAALEKISQEVELGRIAGPFESPPFENLVISPLALRQKANSLKFRLLHNLSAPYDGTSVNFNIPDSEAKVSYANLLKAISLIVKNKCLFLAKTDIADAFRLIPLHPSQHRLMGFKLNNRYYYDKCLPMGCRSSCKIFERFSDALVYILATKFNVHLVVKVIDDFLFLAPTFDECQRALNAFRELAISINLPLAEHKTVGPSQVITFLGIEIDTLDSSCKLPQEKLSEYLELVENSLELDNIAMKEAKALLGKLNFASAVVPAGRTFLRRLYSLTSGSYLPNKKVPLKLHHKKDLRVWRQFLHIHPGKTFLSAIPAFKPFTATIQSDSCLAGYAGVCHPNWFQGSFPQKWSDFDIQFLELFPIFLMISLLANQFTGKRVLIICDNQPIVHTINNLTSKNKRVMNLVRMLALLLLKCNISLSARHVPGKNNKLCDFLSRHQATPHILERHHLSPHPLPVPNALRPQNFRFTKI